MKFHAAHFNWTSGDELVFVIGFACGRVSYEPEAKHLWSFRVYLGLFKVEVNWITGFGKAAEL